MSPTSCSGVEGGPTAAIKWRPGGAGGGFPPPGGGGPREPLLYVPDVVLGDRGRAHVDYKVEPGEDGLREPHVEGRAHAVQRVLEDPLHPAPHLGVVAVAGDVDEAGEEAAVGVAADEEAHPLALLEVQDAHGDVEELLLAYLEELVAGVGLEDLDEVLLVVAAVREPGPLHHVPHLAPHDGHLEDAHAVGGEGVEPQEPL